MVGADIAVVHNVGGTLTVEDRFSESQERPFLDGQQDWELIEGSVTSGVIDAVIRRRLRTCDPLDNEIFADAPQTIIWAFGLQAAGEGLIYHGALNRGIAEITFHSSPGNSKIEAADAETFDLLMNTDGSPKVEIPIADHGKTSAANQYVCTYFNLEEMMPELSSSPRHIIAVDPVIDAVHVAHHMILYGCPSVPEDTTTNLQCLRMDQSCADILWVWAVGASTIAIPPEAGLRVGGIGGIKWARLEMHYYNPLMTPNVKDASGYRIVTTKEIRPFDLGVWLDGPQMLALPPFTENAYAESICPGGCSKVWTNETLTVVGHAYHMHGHGTAVDVNVIRDGQNIGSLSSLKLFDYNHQTIIPAQQIKTLKRGDGFQIKCSWDTSKKQYWSFWGDGTDDEMFITVIFYYPKQFQNRGGSLAACQSFSGNTLNKQDSSGSSWGGNGKKPAVSGVRGWKKEKDQTPREAAQEACKACKGTDEEWLETRPEVDFCVKCQNITVEEYRAAEVARLQGAGGACQALVSEGHCPQCVTDSSCPEGEVARFLLSKKPELCASDGPVCLLAEDRKGVVSCYGATNQIRNGKDGFSGISFHPSDRLAVLEKPPPKTKSVSNSCSKLSGTSPQALMQKDLCTSHGDCDSGEYCAVSRTMPFAVQTAFHARRCESCSRCCTRQDASTDNEGSLGPCPDKCKCEETVLSCQRKAEPSVFCVSTKTCAPLATDDDVTGCAACPDPRDILYHADQKACLPCEDHNDIFTRLMGGLPGGMGDMFGNSCEEYICVMFNSMFGGVGGDMGFMVGTMLNSTCPSMCTPCGSIVQKRNVTKPEPASTMDATSAAIQLISFYSWSFGVAVLSSCAL
jgi:dopamine beta-monooxygenase